MNWQFLPYAIILCLAATMTLFLAGMGWSRRRTRGSHAFILLMLALTEWSVAYACEGLAASLPTKILWAQVAYLAIPFVPWLLLLFVTSYTAQPGWLAGQRVWCLAIIPALTTLAAWTNGQHGWLWSSVDLDTEGQVVSAVYTHGWWFWVFAAHNYVLIFLATWRLIRPIVRSPQLYQRQGGVLLIAAALPWSANLIYLTGNVPVPGLDLTPLAFAASAALIAFGVYRFHLLDLMPVARDLLIERMAEGVLVLDANNRVVDLNPSARRLLRLSEGQGLGQPVAEVWAAYPDLLQARVNDPGAHMEIVLNGGNPYRHVDVRVAPLHDWRSRPAGRLLLLRDITAAKDAEAAERAERTYAEALRDSAATLNDTLELDTVLDRILAQINRVLPSDAAIVYLVDGEQARAVRWRHNYQPGVRDVRPEGVSLPVADTPDLHQLIVSHRPMAIPDTRLQPGWIVLPGFEWVRSCASALIWTRCQRVGFLVVHSATPGFYKQQDAERLQAFAEQAAVAIENARLYADAQQARSAAEALNQELAQRLAELEARNHELDAFAHTVAHDLKNPLSQVVGFADLLASDDGVLCRESVHNSVRAILRAGDKMHSIIEELLLLAQVRRVEVAVQPLDVRCLAVEAVGRLSHQRDELAAEITWEGPVPWPMALGHAAWIEEVWVNYVSNALKYGGRPPHIVIGAEAREGMVRYWVRDDGKGLSPDAQERLFAPFERIDQARATGYGLGLSIVRRIVEKLGGWVSVESEVGQGSVFSFTLPAA